MSAIDRLVVSFKMVGTGGFMPFLTKKKWKRDIPPLTEDQKKMVEENFGLVDWYIKKSNQFIFKGQQEDYRHELCLALMIAVATYDPAKSKLSTHVEWQFRAATSQWMVKNLKFKRSITFKDAFSDLKEETILLSHEVTDENRELKVFREVVMQMPEKDRMNLPFARFIFKDYNKKFRFKKVNSNLRKAKMESEAVLKLLDLMRDRGVY